MRRHWIAASLAVTLGLSSSAACGGLLHQAVKVQKAVEAKKVAVDRVSVKKANGQKTVYVYTEHHVDHPSRALIDATVRETIPDVDQVFVTHAPARSNTSGNAKPNKPSGSEGRPNKTRT